jgi:hypothetical protein
VLAVNRGATNDAGVDTRSGLDLIGQKRLRRVVSGPKAINAEAVDSGRIAVLHPNRTVGIYSARGRLLLSVKPPVTQDELLNGDAVALHGDYLLVLTRARRLAVYNVHSGARLHSWPVHRGATNLAAGAGIAAYAEYPPGPDAGGGAPYKVHVVRLATGKDVVFGAGKWFTADRDIGLGSAGLVYLKNRRTLVFIPLSRVWAAVS